MDIYTARTHLKNIDQMKMLYAGLYFNCGEEVNIYRNFQGKSKTKATDRSKDNPRIAKLKWKASDLAEITALGDKMAKMETSTSRKTVEPRRAYQ